MLYPKLFKALLTQRPRHNLGVIDSTCTIIFTPRIFKLHHAQPSPNLHLPMPINSIATHITNAIDVAYAFASTNATTSPSFPNIKSPWPNPPTPTHPRRYTQPHHAHITTTPPQFSLSQLDDHDSQIYIIEPNLWCPNKLQTILQYSFRIITYAPKSLNGYSDSRNKWELGETSSTPIKTSTQPTTPTSLLNIAPKPHTTAYRKIIQTQPTTPN